MKDNFQCTKEQIEELKQKKNKSIFRSIIHLVDATICGLFTTSAIVNGVPIAAVGGGVFGLASLKFLLDTSKDYIRLKQQIKELENQQGGKIR